eukprot:gene1375-1456_t
MGKGRILKIYETHAVFENLESDTQPCLLVTQKEEGKKFEKFQKKQKPDLGPTSQVVPFEIIFGFYELLSGSYVALVVESEPHVSLNFLEIRKAKKIVIIPLFRNFRVLSEVKQRDEDRYLQLLNFAMNDHTFYFSYTHDITNTQQRIAKLQSTNPRPSSTNIASGVVTPDPSWRRADVRFFWNYNLIDDLVKSDSHEWIVPVMSAFIEVRSDCTVEDVKFTLVFISRRSQYRQGCRFTKRGIDEFGHPANFVETEQILLFPDNRITSYVQIRGSIPLKWTSPVHMRYDPAVFIETDRNKSIDYCFNHIQEIADKYHLSSPATSLVFINLIDNKKDQGKLGVEFKEVIDHVKTKVFPLSVYYYWFDFHHETALKGKWNNLSKLIMQVDELFRSHKFFCKNNNTGEILSWQTGIIRTNCMDNLDRTNVIQSLFARRSLIFQLNKANTLDMNSNNILNTPWKQFEVIFKTIWTNNANAISLGYAGTGALKVDFTKTGKRTTKGKINDGINSCMRYYINNFTDGSKQDAIDLLLGIYRPNIHQPSPFSYRTPIEALTGMIMKLFTLFIFLFSLLTLLLPPIIPLVQLTSNLTGMTSILGDSIIADVAGSNDGGSNSEVIILEKNFKHLQTHLIVAIALTFGVFTYLAYKIIKKGSKIGEMLVIHPELCPEPLPSGRIGAIENKPSNS